MAWGSLSRSSFLRTKGFRRKEKKHAITRAGISQVMAKETIVTLQRLEGHKQQPSKMVCDMR